ncbi:MAG TPA: NAD(P) transhydrogenase subunit alpha [Gemmatimonadales bacterium]|jgi:NAD(P) transhydrogenase subunit alpha|nr:NAD(P) transhydrogenase subunit alpha [Gemmatimonadales bacterium]
MLEGFIAGIVIFTLATFLGVALINRVPPTLHTPLMSGANAVSGITAVGAIIVAGGGNGWISAVLGFLAVVFAMMNVVGGYAVTDRMLQMFKRKPGDR